MNETKLKDLHKLFIDRGYNPVIGTIYQKQEYWLSWYRGAVDGFHTMTKKNAEGVSVAIKKPSLQMAKKVSEDVTSLLFNEKVALTVNNTKAQKILDNTLLNNNFYDEMPNFIELTAGPYGTGVSIQYIADDEVKINYLFGDRVFVIDYDNTTAKSVAVVQEFQRNKVKYTHVMYLEMVEGKYRIKHEMYSTREGNKGIGDPASLSILFSEKELNKMKHIREEDNVEIVEYYTEYDTDTPHFQVFKLAISNNYDVKSPLGISLYANSIGTLENMDEKYYSSKMDSINSRKRIFVDDAAAKLHKTKDADGNIKYVRYFDSDETQFQSLKNMSENGNKAVEAFAPVYDSAQHDLAIEKELSYLSFKTLGSTNYYSFESGAVGYQNELGLALGEAPLRRKRNANLNRLKVVLVGMMKSTLFLEKELGNYTGELDLEYTVQFDDDIFVDDASKLAQLRLDVQDGFAPEYKYVMEAYGLNKEDAKKWLIEVEGLEEEPPTLETEEEDLDGEE